MCIRDRIVDANFTVSVGGNGLIDALAGDGEGNAVHLAVLAGLPWSGRKNI